MVWHAYATQVPQKRKHPTSLVTKESLRTRLRSRHGRVLVGALAGVADAIGVLMGVCAGWNTCRHSSALNNCLRFCALLDEGTG